MAAITSSVRPSERRTKPWHSHRDNNSAANEETLTFTVGDIIGTYKRDSNIDKRQIRKNDAKQSMHANLSRGRGREKKSVSAVRLRLSQCQGERSLGQIRYFFVQRASHSNEEGRSKDKETKT